MMTRIFLLIFVCLSFASPAMADLTFGVVPAERSLIQTKHQAEIFADYLQNSLGEPVKLRVFNSETLLHQWMNRYREVDIAILSNRFLASQSRIEFSRLVDYQPTTSSKISPGAMAGRRGLHVARIQQLKDLLLVMDTDQGAQAILQSMHVASFGTPGAMVALEHQKSRPTRRPAAERKTGHITSSDTAADSVQTSRAEAPHKVAAPVRESAPIPEQIQIDHRSATVNKPQPLATTISKDKPTAALPPADKGPSLSAPADVSTPSQGEKESMVKTSSLPLVEQQKPGGAPQLYSRNQTHSASGSLAGKTGGKHYLLLIVAVLLCGLLAKLILLYQRRPRRRPAVHAPQLLIQHDWSELHGQQETNQVSPPTTSVEPPSGDATEPSQRTTIQVDNLATEVPVSPPPKSAGIPSGQLQLDGKLRPRQIPALLQLISASNQTGSLQVLSKHNEKRITFSSGRITSVSSVNLGNRNKDGFLMNKLGYLLIREGKIIEEQRDRALILCEGDGALRIGEALIRIGALKPKELLESLRYQAKMVLHSLIVFPEGVFEFSPEEVVIPPEDNLNMGVDAFLKEASAHQKEWRNIREMIPSLDTVLDFSPEGPEKVNSGRMTVHQKFVLSLIDGKRPIREVCVAATMLDYELYRFLYLMTKAGILCRVSPLQAQPDS